MPYAFNPFTGNLDYYSASTPPSIGGSITGGTAGSVLFVNPTGIIAQDNANFFWDATNKRLGIGIVPTSILDINNGATGSAIFQARVNGTINFKINGTGAIDTGVWNGTTILPAYMTTMTATVGGTVPTPPNDATKFLNGQGVFAVPAGGGGGLTVGTTTIASGATTRILYDNAGVLGEYTITGTGTVVAMQTAPTFLTSITAPLIIGGTAVGSGLIYKSTTANGTLAATAHSFTGGNNGATTLATILNNGQAQFFLGANVGTVAVVADSNNYAQLIVSNSVANYNQYPVPCLLSIYDAQGPAVGKVLLRIGSNNNSNQLLIKEQSPLFLNYGLTSGNINIGATTNQIDGFQQGNNLIKFGTGADDPGLKMGSFNNMVFNTNGGTQALYLSSTQNVAIGSSVSPTARLHLPAGTATANTAPLKFSLPGVPLTTPEAGVLETNANNIFYTATSLARKALDGTLFTQTADKAVANTVTETSIVGTGSGYGLTLPANFFVVGKTIKVRVSGYYSTVAITGDTVTVKVKYGSTVLATKATTALVTGGTNLSWWADLVITCRSIGATGTIQLDGGVTYQIAGSAAVIDEINNGRTTSTLDTTASGLLDVTVTHSAANASNTITSLVSSWQVNN